MPLLTSKNIWCPCLPHRLICNTFCCCFHLTNSLRVNNNSLSLYFYFVFIQFCSYALFGLWSCFFCWMGSARKHIGGEKIWSTVSLFFCPPSFLLLSLSLDLVVVIPQGLLLSLVYYLREKKNMGNKEIIKLQHLHTKRASH